MSKFQKLQKSTLAVLVALLFVFTIDTPAKAEQFPTARWSYIARIVAGLDGQTPASISAAAGAIDHNHKVKVTATLQNYNSGWSSIASWSSEGYGAAEAIGSYNLSRGTYRLRVYVAVYSGNNCIETTTVYTAAQSYYN